MLRVLVWGTWLIIYFFRMVPKYWEVKRLMGKQEHKRAQEVARIEVKKWAALFLKNIGVVVLIKGAENLPPKDVPVVFAGNHQGFMDIPLILSALDFPRALLAKNSMRRAPFMGKWMDVLGCVYVERDDLSSGMLAMRKCGDLLAEGESVIIFPEGTRSKCEEMGEFKEGTIRIASKAKVPIVPFVIDGTYRILEGNGFKLKKARVAITFLPQVQTAELSRDERKALSGKIKQTIQSELDKSKQKNVAGYL